ncbi:MAG: MBL fold metallo-hydrolase [Bacteroidales bacterium]
MENSITFLGTGTSSGIPMIGCDCEVCKSPDSKDKRLRTSAYIQYEGLKLVIDCGPDFRQQMLRENISYLDAILLTHQHKDHTGGLDDVRSFNYFQKKSFPIYAETRVQDSLKKEYYYAFEEHPYPGTPLYDIHTIDETPFEIKGHKIIPIRAIHYKLPILGYRFGDLAYITDANFIPEESMAKLAGVKVLILSCIRRTKHIAHFSLGEALEVMDKIGAERNYLTHLSHQLERCTLLDKALPDNIHPAYDGLNIKF